MALCPVIPHCLRQRWEVCISPAAPCLSITRGALPAALTVTAEPTRGGGEREYPPSHLVSYQRTSLQYENHIANGEMNEIIKLYELINCITKDVQAIKYSLFSIESSGLSQRMMLLSLRQSSLVYRLFNWQISINCGSFIIAIDYQYLPTLFWVPIDLLPWVF